MPIAVLAVGLRQATQDAGVSGLGGWVGGHVVVGVVVFVQGSGGYH